MIDLLSSDRLTLRDAMLMRLVTDRDTSIGFLRGNKDG